MKPYPHSSRGFSFVELALVFTIIGLLLISVYTGRYLIQVSSYDAIIVQFQQIERAVDDFEKRYDALPGDMANLGGTVDAYFSSESTTINGNGNGIIDCNGGGVDDCDDDGLNEADEYEDLYFWYQLNLTQFYGINAPGAVWDINDPYIPIIENQDGTVPPGPIEGSRVTVKHNTDGLVFDLALYDPESVETDEAILSARQMLVLDERFDDGFPQTGRIRAVQTSGCFNASTNIYNTTDTITCIVRYIYKESSNTEENSDDMICDRLFLGYEKIGGTTGASTCPEGFRGNHIAVCEPGGSWTDAANTMELCEPIHCGKDDVLGDTRTIQCPRNYVGEITQTCSTGGVWTETTDDCDIDPALDNQPCTESLQLACPLGQTGSQNGGIVMACTAGTYDIGTITGTCSDITCSGDAIGTTSTSACPANYASGNTTNSCTITGGIMATQNTCIPAVGSCTPEGSTRDLDCPSGYQGKTPTGPLGTELTHRQTCVDVAGGGAAWVTEYNYCTPITCGGMPIGSYMHAPPSQQCETGIGTAIYVCNENGQWTYNDANCTT